MSDARRRNEPGPPPRTGRGLRARRAGVGAAAMVALAGLSAQAGATAGPSLHRSGPPPVRQPSAARPLALLEIGDSLGEDLGSGLLDVLSGHADVHVLPKATGDSGLVNTTYYNWPLSLAGELAEYHPGVVVVFLGGNDAQSFYAGGTYYGFGSAAWRKIYGVRVGALMHEATAAGAHVLWVGMPVMASARFSADMAVLDTIYAAQAKAHPGVVYLSTWKLFEDAAGHYAQFLPGPGGKSVQVRDPDGIHIDPPAGDVRIGTAVVSAIEQRFKIKL